MSGNEFENGGLNIASVDFLGGQLDDFLTAEEMPKWLSEAYIESILRRSNHDDKLKVKSFTVQQCGGKGESYIATMYRIVVNFCYWETPKIINSRSMIVKILPANAVTHFGSDKYNVQGKEMEMYEKILPHLRQLLEAINKDGNFYPTVLDVDRKLEVIVLEDLMERKFKMADRLSGLDMNHVKLALRKLARMHAASALVLQQNPKAYDHLGSGIFTRKFESYHVLFESLCDAMIDEVSTWEGFEYYADKLKKVRPELIKRTLRVADCEKGDFHVLTHGDFWTNNMMFQYAKLDIPADTAFIDFQFTAKGSPAIDLIYFLYGSTVDEIRQDKIDELLQFYHNEMKNLLTKLGYDMQEFPTLHAFQMQILKKFFYAFTSCLLVYPIMITEDKGGNFETLMSREKNAMDFKRRLYKNPKFVAVAKKILPKFDTKGILDEM